MVGMIIYLVALLSLPFVLIVLLGVNFLPAWMLSRWSVALVTGIVLVGSNVLIL